MLEEYGLLLVQDSRLPSVATIVAGGPIRGSWLASPSAHGTYDVLVALEDRPELLFTKLVSGKVTMVHASLWPALLPVAEARSVWQTGGLSSTAVWLFDIVERESLVRTDRVVPPEGSGKRAVPLAARELEQRLLVHGDEVHTESGAHARVLQTWAAWRTERDVPAARLSEAVGRARLEAALGRLNRDFGATGTLPWQSRLSTS